MLFLLKRIFSYFKELLIVIITTVACSLAAVLIMTLAYMIPINRTNLDSAITLGNQEGWYVDALEHIPSLEKYFVQYQPGTMTVADDVRGFLIADDHEGFNALENAMFCNDYPRYWHGYAFVMRLLLVLFDYKEMRFLSLIIQMFLAIIIFALLREKGEKRISWLSLAWYTLMMPISVACCLVYGCTVDAIFLSTIFVMVFGKKIWNSKSLFNIVFCVIGCIVCFFDLLIFSPMGWAMPFAMLVILYGKEDKQWSGLEKTIRSAVSWVVGYGLFWLLKMVYASLILSGKYEKNIIAGALAEAIWSSGRNNVESFGLLDKLALRWGAVHTNYIHYTYSIYALLIVSIAAVAAIWFVLFGTKKDNRMIPLIIVSASPVIWIFLINTATGAHHIFDYRLLSTEICCSFIMIFLSLNSDMKETKTIMLLKRVGILALIGAVGLLFATKIKEDIDTTNANRLGAEWISFPESGEISMAFSPEYKNIIGIGLSINPETSNGEYCVSIKEDGIVTNEWIVPMSDCLESNWQMGNLDWKVSAYHEYTMEIKAISNCGYGSILVYPNGLDGQVREFGNLYDDGHDLKCQPVGTVRYRKRVPFMKIVTYSSLIVAFLGAMLLTLYSFGFAMQKKTR